MRPACKIEYARDGLFSGVDGEGRAWTLPRGDLVQAIQSGRMICYVTLAGHSHLVTVRNGSLVTFMGELEALPLPSRR